MASSKGNNVEASPMKGFSEELPSNINQLNQEHNQSFKGTIFSVGVVAAVIVGMWGAVFWLYMERI